MTKIFLQYLHKMENLSCRVQWKSFYVIIRTSVCNFKEKLETVIIYYIFIASGNFIFQYYEFYRTVIENQAVHIHME